MKTLIGLVVVSSLFGGMGCGSGGGGKPDANLDGAMSPDGRGDGTASPDAVADASSDTAPSVDSATANDAGAETGSPDAAADSVTSVDAIVSPCSQVDGGDGGSRIVNGGFEAPVVPAAGYQLFATPQSFSSWEVFGATGSVGALSGTYAKDGFTFAAHEGAQTLDLTGAGSNVATGVRQSVPTVPGTSYCLSFWLGNIVDSSGAYGTTSTVDVVVDGGKIFSAVNSAGAGTHELAWQRFAVPFTATSTSTSVGFVNADPSLDNSNILDEVVLK